MSKRNFTSNDQPKHLHFRIRDLNTGEFWAKGGITASYTFSRDREWIRLGASWCSLKDNYVRNRPFLLDDPKVQKDLAWYQQTKQHMDSLKQAGQTDEEIAQLLATLTVDAPSYEATQLLNVGFSKAAEVYGYWESVGVSRSKMEWERNPSFINLKAAGCWDPECSDDEKDTVLVCLTLMSRPEAYTWWRLALKAGCFDTIDLQIMSDRKPKPVAAGLSRHNLGIVDRPRPAGMVIT